MSTKTDKFSTNEISVFKHRVFNTHFSMIYMQYAPGNACKIFRISCSMTVLIGVMLNIFAKLFYNTHTCVNKLYSLQYIKSDTVLFILFKTKKPLLYNGLNSQKREIYWNVWNKNLMNHSHCILNTRKCYLCEYSENKFSSIQLLNLVNVKKNLNKNLSKIEKKITVL